MGSRADITPGLSIYLVLANKRNVSLWSCAMSQYPDSPLSPRSDGIRLLRLMPCKDDNAIIQCQLLNYSLSDSRNGTHLYEALSYVWGDPDHTVPIFIGEHRFRVTENLHAALLRLRDRSVERILWVDAICINQADEQEKERQIQSMARIFGQANRVIVWLGKAGDSSERALEEIRVAASKSTNSANDETIRGSVLKLLQRRWFQRIWVRGQPLDLQELLNFKYRYFKKSPQLGML